MKDLYGACKKNFPGPMFMFRGKPGLAPGRDPVGSAEEAGGGSGVLPDTEPQFLTERFLICPAKEELRPS